MFSPKLENNKETTSIAIKQGILDDSKRIIELQDEPTYLADHLSSENSRFSWENTYNTNNLSGLNKISLNDLAEGCFGKIKWLMQCFGQIRLSHIGAVGPMRKIDI